MAKKLVKNYVFSPGKGIVDVVRPQAYTLIQLNRTFLIKEVVAYIQNQIDGGNPDYVGYTYNTSKCERDTGYVIDALLFDLRYGGNEETRRISTFYWNGEVPQIDGTRIPEEDAYLFLTNLINNFILTNTLDSSPEQNIALQTVNLEFTSEAGTAQRVTDLLSDVRDVILNGLSVLPPLEIGLGRIEVLGKISLEDILIVSNVTDNIVIYNFAEPTKGGRVTFRSGNSESYPQAESVNNGTTIINFNYDTSQMLSTDNIQIFLEESELAVRMNDIATDAMERIKVGAPQAMLDADFEYGLQPTKWQALAFQRGYPSAYEIPASDIEVVNVITDASSGSNDIGASLITVTTGNDHGLSSGDLITIRALSASVLGFNRAEGTFIIVDVPTTNTFTYYAKSKVGTTNGEILAISNTQLRRARFYTGAPIPDPSFSVDSNGASGQFDTALQVRQGVSTINFIGTRPPIGAPLTGTGITAGTQVTAVYGPDNVDGIVATRYVADDALAGSNIITVTDTTGISAGMVVSNGDSATPEQLTITSIIGDNLVLNGQLADNFAGDQTVTSGVVISSALYIVGEGDGATFDVDILNNVYSITAIAAGGTGYLVGDTLFISGADLGGAQGPEDLRLTVTTVDGSGAVTGVSIIDGTENNGIGTATFLAVASTQTTNQSATNAEFIVGKNSGEYVLALTNGGSGFNVGNRFQLNGTDFGGNPDGSNDIFITVTTVTGNAINTFSFAGPDGNPAVASRGDQINIYAAVSISQPTNAIIPAATTVTYTAIATIQVSFASPHGLVPGATIMIDVVSAGTNHQLAAGPYFINRIVDLYTIEYIARTAGNIDETVELEGIVYIRPDAYFSHRPFDGGVQLSTGGPQHGAQAVRMSKKYIRYQSGKGAMYNTGALFAPSFDIASITSTGTSTGSFITVDTDDVDHGLQAGSTIIISGTETVGYDGEYIVNEILDERSFTVVATTQLGSTTAVLGPQCQMAIYKWHGALVRSGPFDDQNGIFWQYDGNTMAVGRRTSTFQCAGTVSVVAGSSTVTGSNTRFLNQLQEGDRIVIKGMTHVVTQIENNTTLYVSPGFRGVRDIAGTKISKVEDLIIPQNEWNLDRCDGTGPSGYNIDVTKMQMIGIQFTWYGAGFIDWMLRGPDGNYVFCHRLKGNNLNTEAYMRTGNLPVRYEVLNEGARSRLTQSINDTATILPLKSVRDFPDSGIVYVDNELISYTGRNTISNTLTGCSRAVSLSNFSAGADRTYLAGNAASHSERQGVLLISTTTSPIISHWGSAYLIDGRFDEDRGYIFSYAATGISVSTIKNTAFLIRLAPSVSNAVTGDLGDRELLNRAQLLLQSISITSDSQDAIDSGGLVIEGVLNPDNYPTNPNNILWSTLQGSAGGGQPSFAQIANGGSVNWAGDIGITTTTSTVQGVLSGSFTAVDAISDDGNTTRFSIRNGQSRFFLTLAEAQTSGIQIGDIINSPSLFPAGTTISQITFNPDLGGGNIASDYVRYSTSANGVSNLSGDQAISIIKQNTSASYTSTNFLFFTQASWTASGATIGTRVSSSVTSFPANTSISNVAVISLDGVSIVRATFNQSSNTTINASSTITFEFGQPPYALPGEQVFSFIASPGESTTLELGTLKELTTTAIGGRGTFPNGPDVLAINVYKVKGTAVDSNIILRWGEAQA